MAAESSDSKVDKHPLDRGTSDEEKELIAQMRAELEAKPIQLRDGVDDGEQLDDFDYLRFLRARQHDVSAAVQMVRAMIAFRHGYHVAELNGLAARVQAGEDVDDRLVRCTRLLQDVVPQVRYGSDVHGRPVFYQCLGDVRVDLMNRYSPYTMQVCHILQMEAFMRDLRASLEQVGPERLPGCVVVVDLAGLHLGHRALLGLVKYTSLCDTLFYPETLTRMLLINSPRFFSMFWKVVRPLVDPQTREKILILGSDYAEEMQKIVDPAEIPVKYGGSNEAAFIPEMTDEYAKELEARFEGEYTEFWPEDKLTKLKVKAGAVQTVEVELQEGEKVQWLWSLYSKDIDFSVVFGDEVVRDKERMESATVLPVRGGFKAEQAGVLKLVFDNSYSRWTSKQVSYLLQKGEDVRDPGVE